MTTEVLPLRDREAAQACAALPVANELVHSFITIFESAEPGPDYETLMHALKQQGAALCSAAGRDAIAATSAPLVTTCRSAVKAVQHRQRMRRQDIVGLVGIVRETVNSIVEGQAESDAALGAATARLDRMQDVRNVFELKQLLAEEVVILRKITSDREREHARVVETLNQRLLAAEEQLSVARAEAIVDPLTEMANRRGFDIALARVIRESHPAIPVVLALFDVDAFKTINDQHGHPAGDTVLRQVAKVIRDSVRQEDTVARIGGDEFALIAAGLTLVQAESRLKTIVQAIAAEVTGDEMNVSVSCGVSEYCAGDTIASLMQRTDTALIDAKTLGKNRVVSRRMPYIRNFLRS